MKKSSLGVLSILAATAMMGQTPLGPINSGYPGYKDELKKRMPLTDEESAKLAELSGKEKKKYVKELKLKYGF